MALDNACTPNDYAKRRVDIFRTSQGFMLFPAHDMQTGELKFTPDNVDPLAESSIQEYPIGSLLVRGIEKWRYCKNGSSALNIAECVQSPARAHAEQDDDIVVAAAAAIGATSVWLTSTANLDTAPNATADNFAGGFLIVNDAAGEGQCCLIKANAAFSTTEDSEFELYDALTIALTTSSQIGLIKNPYNGVIAATNTMTGMPIGVPQLAVTASYYFWCKTAGPAAVNAQEAIALGSECVMGLTGGKVMGRTASTNAGSFIGMPITPGVTNGEKMIVNLMLD